MRSGQARPQDVPRVQGELPPAGAWGRAPHPAIHPFPVHPPNPVMAPRGLPVFPGHHWPQAKPQHPPPECAIITPTTQPHKDPP